MYVCRKRVCYIKKTNMQMCIDTLSMSRNDQAKMGEILAGICMTPLRQTKRWSIPLIAHACVPPDITFLGSRHAVCDRAMKALMRKLKIDPAFRETALFREVLPILKEMRRLLAEWPTTAYTEYDLSVIDAFRTAFLRLSSDYTAKTIDMRQYVHFHSCRDNQGQA